MVRKLSLALASLLAALLLVEAGLRVSGYQPLHAIGQGSELVIRPCSDPDLQYELTPGASTRAWDVDVHINEEGMRGATGEPGNYSGTRVLVLGDSIAFGNYLREEDTFPAQLAAILKAEGDYQVLNLAVPGYDILQELAALQARGLAYRPDRVIVAFCLNDAGHVSPNLQLANVLRARAGNPFYRMLLVNLVSDRIERSRQSRWLDERNDPAVFEAANAGRIDAIGEDEVELRQWMAQVPPAHPARWYSWPERVGRLRHAFRRFAELGAEHGFAVTVVVFPWLIANGGEYPFAMVHAIVDHEIARAGLEGIDLTDDFQRIGLEALRVNASDRVHPDRRGHAIAAQRLAEAILTKKEQDRASSPR